MKTRILHFIIGLSVLTVVYSTKANGQIKVFDNGNVGIKYTTSTPLSKLTLNSIGISTYDVYFYTTSRSSSGGSLYTVLEPGSVTSTHQVAIAGQARIGTSNYQYGVKGISYSSSAFTLGRTYGVYGLAGNASTGYNYGIYGYLYGANNGSAVYGTTSGDYCITGQYAGFFKGDVKVTSALWALTITSSDERLKTNISSIVSLDDKEAFASLNPVKYNLKQQEIVSKDSTSVRYAYDAESEFFQKPKFGFIAQELQELYPDLVYESQDGTLGIDYTGLIPIMVAKIQEQQRIIERLENKIEELASDIEEVSSK